MLSRIVVNTPMWVWPLLLVLLWLGFSQTRAREVTTLRILVMPLAITLLSLLGIVSGFGLATESLVAWAVALAISARIVIRRAAGTTARYDDSTGRFSIPGSWAPLTLILSIFVVKFAVGVTLALQPNMVSDDRFAIAVSCLYGVFSGVFIGRSASLLLTRYA